MQSGARPDVVATWHQGAVCLWSWNRASRREAGRHAVLVQVPVAGYSAAAGTLAVELPGVGARSVAVQRWPARAAAVELAGRPCPTRWSASLAWFHRAAEVASAAVASGRLVPAVSGARVHWRLVEDTALAAVVAALQAGAPPAVAAAGPLDAAEVVEAFADALARAGLRAVRWRPPVERPRDATARAVRDVFRALAGDATVAPVLAPAVAAWVGRWGDEERWRALGRPVVRPRVRMTPPDDADGPWCYTLEVVDQGDPARWCSLAEVAASSALAVEVATEPAHLAVLADVLAAAAAEVARVTPVLDAWAAGGTEAVELDLAGTGAVLAAADELVAAGVELLGPERLVRAAVGLRGTARPAPAGGRGGGLDHRALVSWQPTVDDVLVDPDELLRALAAGADLVQVHGRWVRLDRARARKVLEALDHHRVEHAEVSPATLVRLTAEPGEVVDGEGWTAELLAGLPDDRLVEVDEPAGFTGALRHYQRRGLAWLSFLSRLGLGGCLADDMGLGKTATTLAHLLGRPGPHLVVCPLSVVRNWEQEAARFVPELKVVVHHGGDRARGDGAALALAGADVVVTTYGLVAREYETLGEVAWSTLVLDEAQMVKNPNTKSARAVRTLRAAQRVALTGTPVENRLNELWAILDAVNPGLLGSLHAFQGTYATPIERHGDQEAAARLRRLTQPFVLRRSKADRSLLPDLPDKVEQIAWATLTREQAAMYQAVVDQLLVDAQQAAGMRRRGLVLASLTRLKQICNHPAQALGDGSRLGGRSGKLARFDELVDELIDAGERALVFTQYREMGQLLVRHLAERSGLVVPFLHGGVARSGRDTMVRRFQEGHGPPLLLVSLKAGGTGLNLTAASRVIHYDRWWNPAVEDQATDRAWRIGQTQTVFVHKLVCQGTLEERIGALIDDKRALAATVVGAGAGEAWLSELSTDELRDLVALDRRSLDR